MLVTRRSETKINGKAVAERMGKKPSDNEEGGNRRETTITDGNPMVDSKSDVGKEGGEKREMGMW